MNSHSEVAIKIALSMIQSASDQVSLKVYVVGGAVRDLLREKQSEFLDLDCVVVGSSQDVLHAIDPDALDGVQIFHKAKTVSFSLRAHTDFVCDIASARTETYLSPGAYPQVKLATLEEDLLRRDFSVNAVACELSDFHRWFLSGHLPDTFYDPTNGITDIAHSVIRTLHDKSFTDDPTRIIRALRYLVKLSGTLDAGTERQLESAVAQSLLQYSSSLRIVREILRVADDPKNIELFCEYLDKYHVLQSWPLIADERKFFEVTALLGDLHDKGQEAYRLCLFIYLLLAVKDPRGFMISAQMPKSLRQEYLTLIEHSSLDRKQVLKFLNSIQTSSKKRWVPS